jgi:hypothetical protein
MAVQSIQLLNDELTAVTGRLSRGREMVGDETMEWRGRGDEEERGEDSDAGGN